MSNKKQAIIDAALALFSAEGYDAVSTSKIAKRARVSEGLIFRHFESKEGLLQAVLSAGDKHITNEIQHLRAIESPQEVIRRIMEAPFDMEESEYPYWRLVYALKFREGIYPEPNSSALFELLVGALESLHYENPEMEAHLILSYVDGFMMTLLLKSNNIDKEALLKTLRSKYVSA